ncbi:phospholipase A-2-activating protein [Fistulifera solaris]|uniref:Phospholipase A-2-activating protein n=1 Tax=Fistulifera solaris TaxID=1519565 RepID=A0A1Z5KAE5_FISSO|nr:phospholipase A-2-activating protein [Fistulifera solaris]|eukprot:GAX23166.1 phospholipase A-2-activating protein [Fistulifera solaris]
MQIEWELSQTFSSLDDQGIRTACVIENDDNANIRIVVGTQGGSLCEFHVPSGTLKPISFQHNHAVTAVTSLHPHLVTACKDSVIRYFDATNSYECLGTLEGHTKPVTSLAWAQTQQNYFLLSGSWDGTVKVWDWQRKVLVATLEGHENSTCVVALPSSQPKVLNIATGSAGIAVNNTIQDYQVRIWSVHVETGLVQLLHSVANDHQGPIRNIHCRNDLALMTCSNDGTVILRNLETGKATGTLVFVLQQGQQQHPPMLLSLTSSSDATTCIASAEDGHVVFWSLQDEQLPQTILHPTTVWNVVNLPNGDVATCCDDGQFRVFTRATERVADVAEQEAFRRLVNQAHTKTGPSSEEIAKLPKWEHQAQHRGTSEGQVQVFQKNGIAIAAQWSMASSTWIEVGQVVGNQGSDSSGSGVIDGVHYDHVLPIEVDQTGGGVAQLRVGYNIGENAFVAAQRFLDAHQLPQYHLAQIADYIQQRVGTAPPTIGSAGSAGPAFNTLPRATTGTPFVSYQHLPIAHAKTFDLTAATATTTLSKIQSKLEETLSDDTHRSTLASFVQLLGATQRYHVSHITPQHWQFLQHCIQTLSPSLVFPALDLARMAIRHPDGARYNASSLVKAACEMDQSSFGTLSGPAAVAIPMLTLRLAANVLAANPACLSSLDRELLLACAARHMQSDNKNVRLSVATVLHNLVFSMQLPHDRQTDKATVVICDTIISIIKDILTNRKYETEALSRTLQSLGTLVLSHASAKSIANSLYMASMVEPAASPHGDVAKACAKEVYAVLQ